MENSNETENQLDQEQNSDEEERNKLINDLKLLEIRKRDAIHMNIRRDELAREEIKTIESQNDAIRSHIRILDHLIKKLSLVHSQLTAAPQYKLEKAEVEEVLRLLWEK